MALRSFRLFIFLALALCFGPHLTEVQAKGYPQVMFIFDASGSMWGDAGGQSKIEAARSVLAQIVPDIPPEVKVGLAAYGHRRKGDCKDIEVLIPPGSDDRSGLIRKVNQLTPKGKTPIASAVSLVADKLKTFEDETTIILISDGEETCNDNPCEVVRKLKKSGIKFVLHVVGFGVNAQQKSQLECLAQAGGGKYFSAENAGDLLAAMETVKQEVVQKVEQAKTVTKRAVSKLGKLQITMPAGSSRCLAEIKIIRQKDGKVIKTINSPPDNSSHPLLAGEYKIIGGYANSNYRAPSEAPLGTLEIKGGETTKLVLGALAINVADPLKKMFLKAILIQSEDNPDFHFETINTGNTFYFFKTKPLPPGKYNIALHYGAYIMGDICKKPIVYQKGIKIEAGKQTAINFDTGIQIKKTSGGLRAWELIPEKEENAFLHIEGWWNNNSPLWRPYAVLPGKYDLIGFIKGMDEPLPLAEGLEIKKGDFVVFDPGL